MKSGPELEALNAGGGLSEKGRDLHAPRIVTCATAARTYACMYQAPRPHKFVNYIYLTLGRHIASFRGRGQRHSGPTRLLATKLHPVSLAMSRSNENPWADDEGLGTSNPDPQGQYAQANPTSQNPWQLQQPPEGGAEQSHHQRPTYQTPPDPWSTERPQQHQGSAYQAPPGPPPGHTGGHRPTSAADDTTGLVPEAERSEQREAMEQFEMSQHRPQSTDDRNIEILTQEFPGIDSALVAAIYGDSKELGASREMLGELNDGMQGK